MLMKKLYNKISATAIAIIFAVQCCIVSCVSDDPGINNYYTSTKEYAIDYLSNREQFSKYVEILQRATGERGDLRLNDLLGTYGSYTVFAPTNAAIDEYIHSRGFKDVSELTKEECDTIALNSIIEQAYFTTDYSDAIYPRGNMLEHIMSINADSLVTPSGEVDLRLFINREAPIRHADDSVCNGVVHTVDRVVCTSNDLLPTLISKDSLISLYNEALTITHIGDTLTKYVDLTYGFATDKDRIDSCTWTNNKLCIHTAQEYDNVAYPEKRYFNFTAFMVPDSILKAKYNITCVKGKDNPNSLEFLAHKIYDDMYPEDAGDDNYLSRKNALNRFISYHILDRYGTYYSLTCNDNVRIPNNFDRKHIDISDWYQTLMPVSLMKFSFPQTSKNPGLYINRRGVQSRADAKGVFVRGSFVQRPANGPKNGNAVNGVYHYIDDIVDYGRQTQNVVLNERMRFDCTTLSPDFMTLLSDSETARGHTTLSSNYNGRYGNGGQGQVAASNTDHCVGFKAGYCRNFEFTDNTHLHVRVRVLNYWSYQGDEVTIKGPFDVKVTLPPVPAGTYEIRLFTCTGFASRGILQAYIDDIPQGIPFDMRPGGVALFGYKEDAAIGDNDAVLAFDKAIHNRGWMKGPASYQSGSRDSFSSSDPNFRRQDNTIRRVLGTFTTDGKSNHVLRLQQKMESGGELNFDFIELCPSSVYNDQYFAEDIY